VRVTVAVYVVAVALLLLVAPLTTEAQAPAKVARIGVVAFVYPEPFREGLRELGYVEGQNVAFEVRDLSRREVLQRLLQNRGIVLEGVDPAFAEERISGAFYGSIDAVLQRLLAQTNFVAVYKREGGTSRIARVIIVGKAASQPTSGLPGPRAPALLAPPPLPSPADLARPSGPQGAVVR